MTLSSHSRPLDDGATTTATIVFGGACAVDDEIVIVDAAGTSKTYVAKGSTTAGSLQFINTDATAAATALKLCIDNDEHEKIFTYLDLCHFKTSIKLALKLANAHK
jgi:hypothetical protein